MERLRRYGSPPWRVALVHGGPGARGEMAPLAARLKSHWGVLEPLQTAKSVDGQVEELRGVLEAEGDCPVALVGFSWGAWLSFILAARYPQLARSLILIGSAPFEEKYAAGILETRLGRLSREEAREAEFIMESLNDDRSMDLEKDLSLCRLGQIFSSSDTCDPLPSDAETNGMIDCSGDIFAGVWKEAAKLRQTGDLLRLGKRIRCPTLAIHGDYDPHPAKGVRQPLSATLEDFRFVLLNSCGHRPWMERQARDEFYRVLKEELNETFRDGV
ncbi:MAG: alpha/beta hydrolase [Methanosarcinales archaeon]|nr:alpha/beta hydrolase [Methanosarcinales archaeon]